MEASGIIQIDRDGRSFCYATYNSYHEPERAYFEVGEFVGENVFSSESQVTLVYGQMNETPGARMRVSYAALAITEFFRDGLMQDTLIFVGNVFRFLQARLALSSEEFPQP